MGNIVHLTKSHHPKVLLFHQKPRRRRLNRTVGGLCRCTCVWRSAQCCFLFGQKKNQKPKIQLCGFNVLLIQSLQTDQQCYLHQYQVIDPQVC